MGTFTTTTLSGNMPTNTDKLNSPKQTQSEADQGKLVEQADRDLKNAQFINPLNTDHTANLARLYSWWASRTSDSALKKERGEISSKYYERAVALSRNSATLWGEWALVYLDVLQQPEEAIKHLETALTKDSKYPFVLGLMGEFYSRRGRTQVSFEQKMDDMELASRYFQDAIDNSIDMTRLEKLDIGSHWGISTWKWPILIQNHSTKICF